MATTDPDLCTCPYSQASPHRAEHCRYAIDEPADDPREDDRA